MIHLCLPSAASGQSEAEKRSISPSKKHQGYLMVRKAISYTIVNHRLRYTYLAPGWVPEWLTWFAGFPKSKVPFRSLLAWSRLTKITWNHVKIKQYEKIWDCFFEFLTEVSDTLGDHIVELRLSTWSENLRFRIQTWNLKNSPAIGKTYNGISSCSCREKSRMAYSKAAAKKERERLWGYGDKKLLLIVTIKNTYKEYCRYLIWR